MYLQKIEIQGFKSFANKTTLEFTPGVTAVVGPNGSGKSNIADAVRWVLGEQSLKSLRGKKSGDVIFAGSDKKTRLGFCQVDLHLNNQDRTAPIDYSEVVISRKVYRDGEGEYYINRNRVRLQDILILLAKSNFGQRSYSIIGQGMADLFLSVSPTVRKEYFDEAAGVRQFQLKKEQAEHKLAQTRENLQQAELLLQEIEPRLRSLTRQVHRLERREEMLKQLKEVQHTYYAGLWHDLKQRHTQEEKNSRDAEAKHSSIRTELNKLQADMEKFAQGATVADAFRGLQQQYNEAVTKKNQLLREQTDLKSQRDQHHRQAGHHDLVWLERRHEHLQEQVKQHAQQLEHATTSVAQLEKRYHQETALLDEAVRSFQHLSQELGRLKEKLQVAKVPTIPELSDRVETLLVEQRKLLEKIEAATAPEDLASIKHTAKRFTAELDELATSLRRSSSGDPRQIIALQDQLTKLLGTKDEATSTVHETAIELNVHQEKHSQLERRTHELRQELEKISLELKSAQGKTSSGDLDAAQERFDQEIARAELTITEISQKLAEFNTAEQQKKEEIFSLQRSVTAKQQELSTAADTLNNVKIELAKLDTRLEDLEKEMSDELADEERAAVRNVSPAPTAQPELFNQIQQFKKQLEQIGGIDPQVATEYQETKARYDFLTQQSDDLNKAMADLQEGISNLEETIKKHFDQAFHRINEQFTQYFKILFNGGNASLSLVKEEVRAPEDENDLEDEDADEDGEAEEDKQPQPKGTGEKVVTGIDIHATPPGKRLKGISMLSGGERALTSIALICAIIHNNPSPFVVLDEVDAALDESNSIRFASIIERLSTKTQFIVITHNRASMAKAKILYGVTMGDDGASQLLSVNMEEAEEVINAKSESRISKSETSTN